MCAGTSELVYHGACFAEGSVLTAGTLAAASPAACPAVPTRRLSATGPVVCMSVLSMPPHHYLLVVHEGSGAAVWDLRAQIVVAVLSHNSSSTGADGSGGGTAHSSSKLAKITAAEWLPGSSKGDFATGHIDGSVRIWEMPASASAAAGGTVSSAAAVNNAVDGASKASKLAGEVLQQQPKTLQAQLVSQLQGGSSSVGSGGGSGSPKRHGRSGSRGGVRFRPVKTIAFVAGATEFLAVFGGNDVDRPDGLTLLPLPEPSQVCCSVCWVQGYCLRNEAFNEFSTCTVLGLSTDSSAAVWLAEDSSASSV